MLLPLFLKENCTIQKKTLFILENSRKSKSYWPITFLNFSVLIIFLISWCFFKNRILNSWITFACKNWLKWVDFYYIILEKVSDEKIPRKIFLNNINKRGTIIFNVIFFSISKIIYLLIDISRYIINILINPNL